MRKRIASGSRQWYDIIHQAVALARKPRRPGEKEQAVYIENLGGRAPERVAGSVTDFARRHGDEIVPPGFKVKTRTTKDGFVEVRAVRAEEGG